MSVTDVVRVASYECAKLCICVRFPRVAACVSNSADSPELDPALITALKLLAVTHSLPHHRRTVP